MASGAVVRYKLAFLTSHPIQYQVPLFRKLSLCPEIEFMVYFCSDFGLKGEVDQGFGLPLAWDIPLLEGYSYKFLSGGLLSSSPNPGRFWSCWNPGIVFEIFKGHYDAVLVHGYSSATDWLAFAAAYFVKVPLLLHGETVVSEKNERIFSGIKKHILSALFKRVAAFLFIGTRSREFYESFGVEEKKLFFTPYSVDNEFFRKESEHWRLKKKELKESWKIPESEPVILFVGKLIPRKRPMDCLKAFESIQDRASFIFVGDGELRRFLEDYAKEKKMKKVYFAGFRNQREISHFYAMADLFVFSSSFEPWGMVVNEAMCFGLPIVASRGVASAADLVRSGENGFIYPVGDVSALAGYLARLVQSGSARERMGKRSLELISSWNHDQVVCGILKALHYAVGQAGI